MEKRFALISNNIVQNVVVWDDDNGPLPVSNGVIAIQNDWASPGDWWDKKDQCFYRALPNNGTQG
jgi:hypothetical protein